MIHARMSYDIKRGAVRLLLQGHADAGPKGEDLICAAVSGLALTAAESARQMEKYGLLRRPPKVRLQKGDTIVLATAKEGVEAEVLLAFWTVQNGLFALAKRFPEHIQLEGVLRL